MKLLIVLGDQLFEKKHLTAISPDLIFMAEDTELCTRYKFHKHKLIFFLSAMRTYADEIGEVEYYSLDDKKNQKLSYLKKLEACVKKNKVTEISCFEVEDSFMSQRLEQFCKKQKLKLSVYKSPMFLTSREDFSAYLKGVKKPFMKTFYERQRKALKILVDKNGKPQGGKWSFDEDNRSKIPKDHKVQEVKFSKPSTITQNVFKTVETLFSDHPGKTEDFWLPTDRKGAKEWLHKFLNERFENFGPYEDAISHKTPLLYHSGISAFLNIGLLTPQDIIEATLDLKDKVSINSVEGFIRQIMGWREFVRGIYHNYENKMESENFWGHTRKLKKSWYDGTTGIPPLDDCIRKVEKYGYLHHIERLMVMSNIMLMSEVHPKEVYKWFMEMFIDSGDWVMAANVYGMGQMSEGGIFATKPYICGSNYIIKMSDYKKGDWTDVLDGLYWSFIDKNKKFFNQNPRMSVMVGSLAKMNPQRKKKIFQAAEDFKNKNLKD